MENLIVALCALAFALFLLYHSRIHLTVRFHHAEEDTAATVGLSFLEGTVRLRGEARLLRDESGKLRIRARLGKRALDLRHARAKKTAPQKPRIAPDNSLVRLAIRYVDLSELGLSLTIGIADNADVTARLCGLALMVLESTAGILRNIKPRARVLMRSAPVFGQNILRVRFSCIARVKLGHTILMAAQHAKGVFHAWLTRSKASCAPPWKTSRT